VGLRQWFASPGTNTTNLEAGLFDGGIQPISASTYRGLLSLAGYTAGQLPDTVTRTEAMAIPALNNGVRILTTIAAQLPLVADPVEPSRLFLSEIDPNMTPGWTVARTVDSLLFHGTAYWYVTSRTDRGFPRTVQYVDPSRIQVDDLAGTVRIDNVPVSPNDVIRFHGNTEGLLTCGVEAIRTAAANIRQVRRYAENPRPHYVLKDRDGAEPVEKDDALDYLQALKDGVTTRGTSYIAGFELETIGWSAKDIMLVEARQADSIAMAQLIAVPPRYLAAPEGGSSLTYSNVSEMRRDLVEVGGLAQFLVPVQQRLSQPDVTPRGTKVRFDSDSFWHQITPDQADVPQAQDQANQGATV